MISFPADFIELPVAEIRRRYRGKPQVGLILGTGLGGLAESIQRELVMPYHTIPNFPTSTALAHAGRLVFGKLNGIPVVAMQGRSHLYEGYDVTQVTLPVAVMKQLGIQILIVSNASGGGNPQHVAGDIAVIEDHVNLMWQSPNLSKECAMDCRRRDLRRPNYDRELIDIAIRIARRENFPLHRGVYVAVTGPNYETRAEYRLFRRLGDMVGMSTVPEVIAARQMGIRVLGLSAISNVARPDAPQKVAAIDVVRVVERASDHMEKLVLGVLNNLASSQPRV